MDCSGDGTVHFFLYSYPATILFRPTSRKGIVVIDDCIKLSDKTATRLGMQISKQMFGHYNYKV